MRAALARPGFYPTRPARVDVRETHISWVFLAGDRAYKLKKPLVLPFLDYGTPQRRREMCREEVRLNRRLAPDLYLGVRAVAAGADGLTLAAEDDPRAVDYLVEMRRYDERRTLAAKLECGELKRGEVVTFARVLARFHADARRVAGSGVPVLAVERRMTENFHELLAIVEQRAEVAARLAATSGEGTTITGRSVCCRMAWETLPSIRDLRPVSPRVPSTIASAATSSASDGIVSVIVAPRARVRGCGFRPAPLARATPCSARSRAARCAAWSIFSKFTPSGQNSIPAPVRVITSTKGSQIVSTVAGWPGISSPARSIAACESGDPS